MIVIDSSALIAILTNESERAEFQKAVIVSNPRLICAVNYQESAQVMLGRHGEQGLSTLDDYLGLIDAEVVAFTFDLAAAAISAFKRYGKGFHSKARLNLGDCAAYALATVLDAPLLFKGSDFAHTDVKPWR